MSLPLSRLISATILTAALSGVSPVLLAENPKSARQALENWQSRVESTLLSNGREALARMESDIRGELKAGQPALMARTLTETSAPPVPGIAIGGAPSLAAE